MVLVRWPPPDFALDAAAGAAGAAGAANRTEPATEPKKRGNNILSIM